MPDTDYTYRDKHARVTWHVGTGATLGLHGGMGGFLCPPGHPMHTQGIYKKPDRRPISAMLSLRTSETWVPEPVRAQAAAVLAAWVPTPLDAPEVVAWTRQVLGYFRGCYTDPNVPADERRHVAKLQIDKRDPLSSVDTHAGVLTIREYYPGFTPTSEDFDLAKWGK